MFRRISLLGVLSLIASTALAADFSGTWTATFDTQIGQQSYTYTFKVDGMKLTGTAKSANGEVQISDGKVEGKEISFVEKLNYQGMDLVITYKGMMTSDDEIKFTRDVSGLAMEELVAMRKKDKD
jgi:hypothetical protein